MRRFVNENNFFESILAIYPDNIYQNHNQILMNPSIDEVPNENAVTCLRKVT